MKTIWIILITAVLTAGVTIGVFTIGNGCYYYFNNRYGEEIHQSCLELCEIEKQESSGIADWKTYTNDQYGFSIQYPEDWHLTTSTDEGLAIITNFEYPATDGTELKASQTKRVISIVENPNGKTARQLFEASHDESALPGKSSILEEPITVDNVEATKLIVSGVFHPDRLVYIPSGDKMILITCISSPEELDKMLDTFKFFE